MMDFLGGAMLTLTAPVASLASRAMTGVPMFRSYFFGTTDEGAALQLPPVVHFGDLMHMFRTHGIWGHHLVRKLLTSTHIHTHTTRPVSSLPITLITPNTVFYSRCSLSPPLPPAHPYTSRTPPHFRWTGIWQPRMAAPCVSSHPLPWGGAERAARACT